MYLQSQVTQTLSGVNVLLVQGFTVEQRGQPGHESVHGVDVRRQTAEFRLELLLLEEIQRQSSHGVQIVSHVADRALSVPQSLRERIAARVLAMRVVREHLGGQGRRHGSAQVTVRRYA